MNVWAIIPVKPLRDSKSRLAGVISADERAKLTGRMLTKTLEILQEMAIVQSCLVVSRDPAVLKIARKSGALTYGESEKQDLNMALARATHIATVQKADCVLILPSDLPFITAGDIDEVIQALLINHAVVRPKDKSMELVDPVYRDKTAANVVSGSITAPKKPRNGYYLRHKSMVICSDQEQDGTNALLICQPAGFTFQYGPGSFRRHILEAERLGMAYTVVDPPGIRFDLDTVDDWHRYRAMIKETAVPIR